MATLQLRMDPSQMVQGGDQGERALAGVTRGAKRAESAVEKLTRSQRRLNTSLKGGVPNMRMASMQLSQVAQQGAATGNYMQALAIQAPDLALGFGAVGIIMGAMVPILYGVAQGFLGAGEDAKTLEDRLDSLAASMKMLKSVESSLSGGISGLREEYGAFSQEAIELLRIQREISSVQAQMALGAAIGGIGDAFGDFDFGANAQQILDADNALVGLVQRYGEIQDQLSSTTPLTYAQTDALLAEQQQLEEVITNLDRMSGPLSDLADKLGLSADEARGVAAALADMSTADGPQAQSEAAKRLADAIYDATDGLADADAETLELYQQLLEASKQGLQLAAIDYASGIGAGADEAARLASNLMLANKLSSRFGLGQTLSDEDTVMSQSVLPDAGDREAQRQALENFNKLITPKASRRSGGAGSAAREIEQTTRAYDALISRLDPATRASLEFEKSQKIVNDALAAGHINATQAAFAFELLDQKMRETEFETVYDGITDISDALGNAIAFSGDLSEAMENSLRQIYADIVSSRINDALTALFDVSESKGGWFSGLLKSIFQNANGNVFDGGKVQAFASGGVVSSATMFPMQGGLGVMGEAGPEAIMPLKRGANGKLGVQASGGGQSTNLEVHIHENARKDRSEVRQSGGRIDVFLKEQMDTYLGTGKGDRAMKSRFGVTPVAQGA